MVDENVVIQVDDASVDETIAKIEGALDKKGEVEDVKETAEEAKVNVKEAIDVAESSDIKGTNLLVRRTVAQLPGVREAYHLVMLIRTMLRVSPEIALILGAWMAGRAFVDWLQGGVREAEEYRKMIMEARGFTKKSQYADWQRQAETIRQNSEAYRGGVPQ
jgi:hypothetical protein